MDHCGAPTSDITIVSDAQGQIIAEFDNECLLENGHLGNHVITREDGATLSWSSDAPGFRFEPKR